MTFFKRITTIILIATVLAAGVVGVLPPPKVQATGGMEQVIIGGKYDLLHNTNTEYNSLVGGRSWWTDTTWFKRVVSTAGTIKDLRVRLNDSPGAGKSYDFTLMLNGNPTGLTLEIADAATGGNNATEVAVVAGDIVYLRSVPTGSPTARYATWTSIFAGDTANESLILGGTGGPTLNTASIEYTSLMTALASPSTTEDNFRQVFPTEGTIKKFYVELNTGPGSGGDAYRFTLRIANAGNSYTLTDTSLTVTITNADTTGFDTANNVTVAAGDILTIKIEPLNSPSATPIAYWGMTFLADTDGESVILGGSPSNLDDTTTYYQSLITEMSWSIPENNYYQLGQTCTLKKLYIKLSTAPGEGKKYNFTVRIAGADSNVVVEIADTATTGNSGGLSDTVVDDNYVNLKVSPTSTPAAVDVYWGLVSYRPPAPPSLTTNNATNILETTATLSANITATSGVDAITRGFEWDTDSGAPYSDNWTESGSFGRGNFTRALIELTKGELYYYRAYATSTYGTGYGSEVAFLTKPDKPSSFAITRPEIGTQLDLTWDKGGGAQKTYIRGKDGSYPTDRSDGYLVYNGTSSNVSDTGLIGGHTYYYLSWSYATEGGKEQYSDLFDNAFGTPGLAPKLWIIWEYGATFTDLTGNDNDATPTFRTASSSANVSAVLLSFGPVSPSEIATYTLTDTYAVLSGNVTSSGGMYTDLDLSKLPAAPITELLTEAGVPAAAWWFPFLFLGIGVIGLLTYGATTITRGSKGSLREGSIDGSLLTQFIVMEFALVVLGFMGPIPLWPSFLFPIAGVSLILSRKHLAWG